MKSQGRDWRQVLSSSKTPTETKSSSTKRIWPNRTFFFNVLVVFPTDVLVGKGFYLLKPIIWLKGKTVHESFRLGHYEWKRTIESHGSGKYITRLASEKCLRNPSPSTNNCWTQRHEYKYMEVKPDTRVRVCCAIPHPGDASEGSKPFCVCHSTKSFHKVKAWN